MVSVESAALSDFLRSRGAFVHEHIELFGAARGGERGAFAVEPIRKGTLLLRLPERAVMRACEDGSECDWMPAAAREASPILRTALFLMREQALGPRSQWAASRLNGSRPNGARRSRRSAPARAARALSEGDWCSRVWDMQGRQV